MARIRKNRVVAYIDGFNLYYGMRSAHYRRFLWLDLKKLVQNLCSPLDDVVEVKYFTSRISEPEDKRLRQTTYIEALVHHSSCTVIPGTFLKDTVTCKACGAEEHFHNEKMTDVNIATAMIVDAYTNAFETALLISGDSDLVPALKAVRIVKSDAKLVVAFPPNRYSNIIARLTDNAYCIGRGKFSKSLLPETVKVKGKPALHRPAEWDPNAT
jgi:hypothetical protein